MNKSKIIIISTIFFMILSMVYDNFYPNWIISGQYIYEFPISCAEGPSNGDILILKENGHFESDTWGNGTFEINGSTLDLSYAYELGNAEFQCSIYRPLFWGSPRINMDRDLRYYFKKIN
jgi:hypothetical protein